MHQSKMSRTPLCSRVQKVSSFAELVSTPFDNGVNALCWERELPGDFGEVVNALAITEGIHPLEAAELQMLSLSPKGQLAIEVLMGDLRLLQDHGLDPMLECIHDYLRDANPGPVPTDVLSFHVDSATAMTDTYLCTYFGPSSERLNNEQALRRVDVPETRAALLQLHGGEDNEVFQQYLSEHCFDLHYVPIHDAAVSSFGVGNLWRIAVECPGSTVLPCIHRAPATIPGQMRLLLIS